MKKCYGAWRLLVWLSTLLTVSSMPQNPSRYQQDRFSDKPFKIFRLHNTSVYDYTTGTNHGTVGGIKDDKVVSSFIQANLPNLVRPNITVSLIKNNLTINTRRTSTNKIILKKPSVGYVQSGTVGEGPKVTKKVPIKLRIPTVKPTVLNKIVTIKRKNTTWPYTFVNDKTDLELYKNYTQLSNVNDKQDIVLFHIPGPDPNPEVTSYSPQYETPSSIPSPPTYVSNNLIPLSSVETYSNGSPDESDFDDGIKLDIPLGNFDEDSSDYVPSIDNLRPNLVPLSSVETSSNGYPFDDPGEILNIPLGQFNLDMVPTKNGFNNGNNCPTLHLSSNVFGAETKQNCPDLNVVLNNHYQQNMFTERIPAVSSAPQSVAADSIPQVNSQLPLSASPAQAAATPISTGSNGGGFPSLGVPQLPSLPEFPELSLPNIKGLFDIIGYLWTGIQALFRLIWPILVAIPIAVFFKTLILTLFTLFPWWLPALFFGGGQEKKSDVFYHKHVHKPIIHPDGWFWNQNTKTWINIGDYYNQGEEIFDERSSLGFVPKMIEEFKKKYYS